MATGYHISFHETNYAVVGCVLSNSEISDRVSFMFNTEYGETSPQKFPCQHSIVPLTLVQAQKSGPSPYLTFTHMSCLYRVKVAMGFCV